MRKNRKRDRYTIDNDVVLAFPLEVYIDECKGNTTVMIKRFMKKVRKEEVFKPIYERMNGPVTKGQKGRKKRTSKVWLEQKRRSKLEEIE